MTAFSYLRNGASEKQEKIRTHETEIKQCEERIRELRKVIEYECEEIADMQRALQALAGNPFPGKSLNSKDIIAAKIKGIKEEVGAAPDVMHITQTEMDDYRNYYKVRGFSIPEIGEPMYCEGVLLKVIPEELKPPKITL